MLCLRETVVSGRVQQLGPDARWLGAACRACTNARRRQRDRSGERRPASQARSTILATALRKGDIATVQALFRGATTAHWGWVCETIREGHLNLAEALLESGVERNVFTMAAMADAKGLTHRLGRVRTDARLTANMEPASAGVTPLHLGCASDWKPHGEGRMAIQVRVAEILAEHGADLHAVATYRGIGEATPLYCACWSSENFALVCWLLDNGARRRRLASLSCAWPPSTPRPRGIRHRRGAPGPRRTG